MTKKFKVNMHQQENIEAEIKTRLEGQAGKCLHPLCSACASLTLIESSIRSSHRLHSIDTKLSELVDLLRRKVGS